MDLRQLRVRARAGAIVLGALGVMGIIAGCSSGDTGERAHPDASGPAAGTGSAGDAAVLDAGGALPTQGIAMITTVTARGEDEVTVHSALLVGGDESNTYVTLVGEDALYAEADGLRVRMDELAEGEYEAVFARGLGSAGVEYSVQLVREPDGEVTADALGNRGTLPAPFELAELGSDAVSRSSQALDLMWAPSGTSDDMQLELDDEQPGCIFTDGFDLPGDTGRHRIDAGSLESTSTQMPETCQVTATLVRERTGEVDPTLDPESTFTLRQERTVTFTSAP